MRGFGRSFFRRVLARGLGSRALGVRGLGHLGFGSRVKWRWVWASGCLRPINLVGRVTVHLVSIIFTS